MHIELVNPLSGNLLTSTNEGLLDNSNLVFPLKLGAYRIVQDEFMNIGEKTIDYIAEHCSSHWLKISRWIRELILQTRF